MAGGEGGEGVDGLLPLPPHGWVCGPDDADTVNRWSPEWATRVLCRPQASAMQLDEVGLRADEAGLRARLMR